MERARACTGCARGMHGACTECARSVHGVCTERARSMNGACNIYKLSIKQIQISQTNKSDSGMRKKRDVAGAGAAGAGAVISTFYVLMFVTMVLKL